MEEKDSIAKDFATLFYHFSNLSKYPEEEFNAIYGKIPMTEEIFEACVKTAFDIFDFENIGYLSKKFPEFAEKNKLLQNKKFCPNEQNFLFLHILAGNNINSGAEYVFD